MTILKLVAMVGMLVSMNSSSVISAAISHADKAEFKQALDLLTRGVVEYPDHAGLHSFKGEMMLRLGHYRDGWKEYEWRHKNTAVEQVSPGVPFWLGGMATRPIIVQYEQGIGDVFHFMRYLAVIRSAGIKFIFHTPEVLRPLFSYVPELLATGQTIDVEQRTTLLSLPHVLSMPNPADAPKPPYIFAPERSIAKWSKALPPGFRIGVAWKGSVKNRSDATRSFKASDLAPIASVRGVKVISLQVDAAAAEVGSMGGQPVRIDKLDASGAFVDTAGIIKNLDLVITCDSSLAHLAGAMNCPVWVALPFVSDWRWGVSGEFTPWYPSMRLFRQTIPGDWAGVFEVIASELRQLA